MKHLLAWLTSLARKLGSGLPHPYVQSYGAVQATDEASALAQYKTYLGTLPPNAYLPVR